MSKSNLSSATATETQTASTKVALDQKPNPFDPNRFRVSQDYMAATGVKQALTMVPVGKPAKEWFVRTHPDATYRLDAPILELKSESESYLVDPGIIGPLSMETDMVQFRSLITTQNRQGDLMLWSIKLPDERGKIDTWNQSAMEAAGLAQKQWVSVRPNRTAGGYNAYVAQGQIADPKWDWLPPFSDILSLAFKGKIIETMDHPVVKQLRGE